MSADPLALLQKMQADSLATAPGLPEEAQAVEMWSGVGFRVGDVYLVTSLDSVTEILQYPRLTPVPRTQKWLKGVANIRGTLVTIIDLPEYFDKKPVNRSDRSRLIILNAADLSAGLLVDEVFGLRHFDEEFERQKVTGLDDPAMALTEGAFLRDNTLWGIFSMRTLAKSEMFLHVAA
ncbi:MAG: chemotaxis protein CheW [Gammaproteobacteria bacterium]|nr:MAG: chemotaxis protein CheW [Gammaproteobacteria bacterium]